MLGIFDILVLCAALAVTVLIGYRSSKGNKDVESYLLGGRDLPWWAILGSIVATETSTATVLSLPGVGFGPVGMKFLQLAIGYFIGRTIVVRVLLPLYFKGKLFTAYQVLDLRFGPATRKTASLLFLVTRNLGDGLRLFLAGIVLQSMIGWSFGASILMMGTVTIVYTWFGGLRSVVWNDCVQFLIYMIGGIASLFIIANRIPGGWDSLWTFAEQHDKLQVLDFQYSIGNAFNIWAGVIGGAVLTIGTHGTDHMMVQRYLSARSQADAGRAIFLSAVVVFLQYALFLFIGVQLACYYSYSPELTFEKNDRIFAHFIVNSFPQNTGLVGLMLAAILSAAMSTLSSSLNSSASAFLSDFYIPMCREEPSADRQLIVSRRLTLVFGLLQMAIGFFAMHLGDTVVENALKIAGFSGGLLLGVFLLGVCVQSANQSSALIGMAGGFVVLVYVQFFLRTADGEALVAWPWLAIIGTVSTLGVGGLMSLIKPAKSENQ